ncbi:MAG: extracellular solute-binding protein [Chloroflexi bacterium]|nr:extracellular solute-binding protein [Chloroflexota bacterium]MBV9595984.1 extracellular solute-binding protein [Chloroflexota bacterium]
MRALSRIHIYLTAVVALALVATACSSSASNAPAAPAGAPTQPAAAAQASVSNPPTSADMVDGIQLQGKNVEVTYWHNRPQQDQDLLQSMLDEFNKSNPYGITAHAEIAGAGYPDVYNKVNAAIQAGQPPEMSVAYQNQAAFYRAQNAVIDLTPFINSSKYGLSQDDLHDYFQAFLDSDKNPQFSGERLGFPTQRSMDVMYYNTDWLTQLGYNGPPTDWKSWEDAACKASDGQNKYGWAVQHDASTFAALVFGHGGQVLADDGQSYVFNSPAGVDSLAMMQRMFKNKCAVEVPTSEKNGEQNRFGAGNALFVFGSSSGMPFYQQAVTSGGNFQWSINMPPTNGQPAINLYGASVSVYKTTPEKELASWLVLKYLGEKAQTTKWAVNTGYLPVRQSAKQDVIDAYKADPKWGPVADSYAKMFDWAQYSKVESPVAGYDPVRDLIDKQVMTRVMTDSEADPKQILDDVVNQANQILQENAPKK